MTARVEYDKSEQRGMELEYNTLKSEILKRIEMRQQIVAVALTLAGVFLGVGLSKENISLIYPPLAAFLALGWGQNDFRIRDAARYIRENLEGKMPGLRYETNIQEKRFEKSSGLESWRFVVLSHGGIFIINPSCDLAVLAVSRHVVV
jgi:uncharacterized membrane protein YqaE (UPF0057 family)